MKSTLKGGQWDAEIFSRTGNFKPLNGGRNRLVG